MSSKTIVSGLTAGLLTTLIVACATDMGSHVRRLPSATIQPLTQENDQGADAERKQKQREIVHAFRRQARDFLWDYYDFYLGLRDESPNHEILRSLLLEVKEDLASTLVDPGVEKFVLGELDHALGLKDEMQLRKTVNEVAFLLQDLARWDSADPGMRPFVDIYVEEPWRKLKHKEVVLDCSTQELLNALSSDSLPNDSHTGLEVYRQLGETSLSILEETLANDEGQTTAELVEIERAAELDPEDGSIDNHPVLIFLVKKTLPDRFDQDEFGPKSKTFQFKMRQVIRTMRDRNGIITEHVVTNEILEPVLVGGNKTKGQYGLHYYKTVLTALPVKGDEHATRVQFRLLSVPDFRGPLASSRLRTAVSIFIRFENRGVTSRTLERVNQHWPQRVLGLSETDLVKSSTQDAPLLSSETAP